MAFLARRFLWSIALSHCWNTCMSGTHRYRESLRHSLEQHLSGLKGALLQGDFVAAHRLVQQMLALARRMATGSIYVDLLRLYGLLCELLGDRVEAGLHYCVAMRLAQQSNPALAQVLLRRLALLAHPEQQHPLLPRGEKDEQLQALAQFLTRRLDCLWQVDPAQLIELVQIIEVLKAESDVGRWVAEDLSFLASQIGEVAFRELIRAAPSAQWRNALIHARPEPQEPPA